MNLAVSTWDDLLVADHEDVDLLDDRQVVVDPRKLDRHKLANLGND